MSRTVGLYTEHVIFNYTSFNVVVIHANGTKTVIPAHENKYNGINDVVIQFRSQLTSTIVNANRDEAYLPGLKISLKAGAILNAPIFVKEINAVIATEQAASVLKHPYGCMDYVTAASAASLNFVQSVKESVIVSITANDPLGKHNVLYAAIGNSIVKIPIQSNPDSTLAPQLVYVVQSPNGSTTLTVDLEDLYENDSKIVYLEQCILSFVTLDEVVAIKHMENYKSYTQETLQEYLEEVKKKYDEKLAEIKNVYEIDKLALENQCRRIKESLANKEHDYNILMAKYEETTGTLNASRESTEKLLKLQAMNNAKQISDNNVKISNTKAVTTKAEQDFKLWHAVAIAAAPVITVIAGVVVKKWIDSK